MTVSAVDRARPIRGLRVVTLADDRLPSLGKAFVDLGADVEVLRPARDGRPERPLLELLESRGKRITGMPAELPQVQALLADRLATADVLICGRDVPGFTDVDALARVHPQLVIAVVTEFGLTGERSEWVGSEAVFDALSGTLSRSGEPGREPLVQPGELFTRGAAQQIAWAILVTMYRSFRGAERGAAVLDCSIFECGIACLDPAFGMTGSGTPDSVNDTGRPDASAIYPIFRVRDGFVRVCVLARNQWESLLDWMGRPEELAGEDLLTNPGRYARAHEVVPLMAAFFADLTTAEVIAQCRERRLPAAPVMSLADVLAEEHYHHVGVLAALGEVDGRAVVSAEGMARINGIRTVPRQVTGPDPEWGQGQGDSRDRGGPLSGITVLDLGVIVAGAQTSLLFAEQGARVIRVENRQFPDGMRRSFESLTPALARGHFGKENLGLDLRSNEGREIFKDLVRRADIVSSNFKPGTVERLGISYDDLVAINPEIVCVESSAFGDFGPWRTAMGYGPLVRAGSGLTWLWRYDADSAYFADGITIYPDHCAGRVAAIAALACVLDRRRTRQGAHVTVAQSDIALVQLGELLARESLAPGSVQPPGRPIPPRIGRVVQAAAGDDQWCVVDPQTPEQVDALRQFLSIGPTDDLDTALASYAAARDPASLARGLQGAGVPAAPMLRPHELVEDTGLQQRGMYVETTVAGTGERVTVERYPVLNGGVPQPQPEPAPAFGAHTRAILAELGHPPAEIERLLSAGVAQLADSIDSAVASRPGGR